MARFYRHAQLEEVHIDSTHIPLQSFGIYINEVMGITVSCMTSASSGQIYNMEGDDNFCCIANHHFCILCLFYCFLLSRFAQKRRCRS